MTSGIQHPHEPRSNADRTAALRIEPRSLRTYTPSQLVIAKSAGVYHWTPEGRRLFDFSSGVLVANLGHNPAAWMKRFFNYMGWEQIASAPDAHPPALPMTAYNAITPIEVEASRRLIEVLQKSAGGKRLEQVMWAASGSEAIQKAIWTAWARDRTRPMILATRFRLPRQERNRQCRYGERDRQRTRSARPILRLPDAGMRRHFQTRKIV